MTLEASKAMGEKHAELLKGEAPIDEIVKTVVADIENLQPDVAVPWMEALVWFGEAKNNPDPASRSTYQKRVGALNGALAEQAVFRRLMTAVHELKRRAAGV